MKVAYIIIFCLIGYFGRAQTNEIRRFYLDIFHDSTTYTLSDYKIDSLEVIKEIQSDSFLLKTFGSNPGTLLLPYRCKIDTLQSTFRIINHCGAFHFGRLIVFNHFYSFHKEGTLQSIVANDTNFKKKITQEDINIYYKKYGKKSLKKYKNCFEIITKSELNSLIENDTVNNWESYYQKYEYPLVQISIPFFNEAKDYAIFEYTVTFRKLDSYYFRGFYRKSNGKWRALSVEKIGVS